MCELSSAWTAPTLDEYSRPLVDEEKEPRTLYQKFRRQVRLQRESILLEDLSLFLSFMPQAQIPLLLVQKAHAKHRPSQPGRDHSPTSKLDR